MWQEILIEFHVVDISYFIFQSMLRYKSFLYRTVETGLLLPTLFLGSTEERQVITTELFEDYQEDSVKHCKAL